MLILVIVKHLKRFKQSRRELQASKVCIFSNKTILVGKRLPTSILLLGNMQTLDGCNSRRHCLIRFKFFTITNISMLFQIIIFLLVLGEYLKCHATPAKSPLRTVFCGVYQCVTKERVCQYARQDTW